MPSDPDRSTVVPADERFEEAILVLLDQRGTGKTICPSEVARAVGGDGWRRLMEPSRAAARRLVASGDVQITQRGVVVEPATVKGAIRIRRRSDTVEPERGREAPGGTEAE